MKYNPQIADIIRAIWTASAILTFFHENKTMHYIGMVIICYVLLSFFIGSHHKPRKQNKPQVYNYVTDALTVDIIYSEKNQHFELTTSLSIPQVPMITEPTPEDYEEIIVNTAKEWLMQSLSLKYKVTEINPANEITKH